MDIQQSIEKQEEMVKLRLTNEALKKELEKEQLLHKMLFNEWKKLSAETETKEHKVHQKEPANPFYKYAFYTLLIALILAYYFLYYSRGNEKLSSPVQPAASIVTSDSIKTTASALPQASVSNSETLTTVNEKPANNRDTVRQIPLERPVISQENKAIIPDTSRRATAIVNIKPIAETRLTNDIKDSIYWVGWNAYFTKARSSFRKSSPRYRAWYEGWKDGKAQAKKLLDSSRS